MLHLLDSRKTKNVNQELPRYHALEAHAEWPTKIVVYAFFFFYSFIHILGLINFENASIMSHEYYLSE